MSAPRMVKVLGIAPSDICTKDHGRARRRVTRHAGRVVLRKNGVVSINTFSANPNSTSIDRRRRLLHVHGKLTVIHQRRPSTLISVSAFHPSMTHVTIRRFKTSVVGSVSRKHNCCGGASGRGTGISISTGRGRPSSVLLRITELRMPCVLVSLRTSLRGAISIFLGGVGILGSVKMGSVVLSPNCNFKGSVVTNGCSLLSTRRRLGSAFGLPLLIYVSEGHVI